MPDVRLDSLKETSSPIHVFKLSELSLVPSAILATHTHNDTITPVPSLLLNITTLLPLPSHNTEEIYNF
jgi:ribonuclease BN (tRNA processing enzyme)